MFRIRELGSVWLRFGSRAASWILGALSQNRTTRRDPPHKSIQLQGFPPLVIIALRARVAKRRELPMRN